MKKILESSLSSPPDVRASVGQSIHGAICCLGICGLTWSLLTPDPFTVVEGSSLVWVSRLDDLILHVGAFAAISVVLFSFAIRVNRGLHGPMIVAMSAYAVLTELLQSVVPGRTCDVFDMVANMTGILAGFALVQTCWQLAVRRISDSSSVFT